MKISVLKTISVLFMVVSFISLGNAQVTKGKKTTKKEQKAKAEEENPDEEEKISPIDSLEKVIAKKSQLFIGSGYMSNVAYQGRNYGVQQIGASPGLDLKLSNGLSFSITGNFWSQASPKNYAETDIGIGYEVSANDNLSFSFGFERWMPTNPINVGGKPLSTNYSSLGVSLELGLVSLATNLYYTYTAGTTGGGGNFVLSKAIEMQDIFGMDKIKITPALFAEWGIGDFAKPINSGKSSRITNYTDNIKVVNYQIDLPITYKKIGKFEFGPTFHYAIPQNITATEGSATPFFYITADLQISLAKW